MLPFRYVLLLSIALSLLTSIITPFTWYSYRRAIDGDNANLLINQENMLNPFQAFLPELAVSSPRSMDDGKQSVGIMPVRAAKNIASFTVIYILLYRVFIFIRFKISKSRSNPRFYKHLTKIFNDSH